MAETTQSLAGFSIALMFFRAIRDVPKIPILNLVPLSMVYPSLPTSQSIAIPGRL